MNGPKGTTVQFKILNVLELIMNLFVNVRMVSKEMDQNLVFLKASLKKKMVRKHTYMHGLRTPNEVINQRYLKNGAAVADKIRFSRF